MQLTTAMLNVPTVEVVEAAEYVGDGGPLLDDRHTFRCFRRSQDLGCDQTTHLVEATRHQQNVVRFRHFLVLHPRYLCDCGRATDSVTENGKNSVRKSARIKLRKKQADTVIAARSVSVIIQFS